MEITTLIVTAVSVVSLFISATVLYLHFANRNDALEAKQDANQTRIVKSDELARQLEVKLTDIYKAHQDLRDEVGLFRENFQIHIGEDIRMKTQLEGCLFQLSKIETKLDKLLERE